MCGIVAYLGSAQARAVLLSGLARLEYRGYDSAGLAVMQEHAGGGAAPAPTEASPPDEASPQGSKRRRTSAGTGHRISVVKSAGKVANLSAACSTDNSAGTIGIAHTRWATHGPPTDVNAHPHTSEDGTLAVVHNGIVENFDALRAELLRKGYTLRSQTDTELIAHLIADVRRQRWMPLEEAVRQALTQVHGAFGIAVLSSEEPDLLIGARKGSPLVLGIGTDEFILASDAAAVVEWTKQVSYLQDNEMVIIQRGLGYQIKTLDNVQLCREVQQLELSLQEIQKGSHKHFMLKEITEQPHVLQNCMRGRVLVDEGVIKIAGLNAHLDRLTSAKRFIIVACGTSWHAGLVGEYLIETLAKLPVEVEYASEFRYRRPLLFPDDVMVAVSQSGETADTLAAIHLAKQKGCLCLGVCNTVGSSIARETDGGVYLHAGPEIGVASTKAFSAQVLTLAMIALKLAQERGELEADELRRYLQAMQELPALLERVLAQKQSIHEMAKTYRYASNFLYLGRGFHFPVALEGALKLKEISYIHAEGYPAAEMKHGPIALIDPFMPVVVIAPASDPNYAKLLSNIQEVLARGGAVIAITEEGNDDLDATCECVIKVPKTEEFLAPLLSVVPLQLLAYFIADMRKCNVDQPRNLAKSVTVE
jgi:glucosamine--fructose-6-phosphate aminotransferase (isomerizing)